MFPVLRLLLTVKHGRMRMEWNAYRDCLCMKEGNCVEVSVSPRVVRDVLVYKDQVVIGCSRSIIQYRTCEKWRVGSGESACRERVGGGVDRNASVWRGVVCVVERGWSECVVALEWSGLEEGE